MSGRKIMLVAAEASGDTLGAALARSLRTLLGEDTIFVGLGGEQMAAEGVTSPFDMGELSIMGPVDALMALRRASARADEIAQMALRERPDVAVLIDSWGFSYLVAKRLRVLMPDLPLVKYVAPQVWASRPGRAKTLARLFDRLLATLPFEPPIFEAAGAKVRFVGYSALHREGEAGDPVRLRTAIGAAPEQPILLILPGSRRSEIKYVLPPFEAAADLLAARFPDLVLVIAAAPTVADLVTARAAGWAMRAHVVEGDEAKRDAMAAATVALACSGTVSTELAMAGVPMVIAYKVSALAAMIIRLLIRVKYITLFNIVAGRAIAPEFIQDQCAGPTLADAIAARLDDPALRQRQVAEQFEALDRMGRGGADPADRAADEIVSLLAERSAGGLPKPDQPRLSTGT